MAEPLSAAEIAYARRMVAHHCGCLCPECRSDARWLATIDARDAEINAWAEVAMLACAGNVGTPERGYAVDGGPGMARGDVLEMRRVVDGWRQEIERLRGLLQRTRPLVSAAAGDFALTWGASPRWLPVGRAALTNDQRIQLRELYSDIDAALAQEVRADG